MNVSPGIVDRDHIQEMLRLRVHKRNEDQSSEPNGELIIDINEAENSIFRSQR